MYVYVCIYLSIYLSIYLYIIYISISLSLYIYIYISISLSLYTYIYIYIYGCLYKQQRGSLPCAKRWAASALVFFRPNRGINCVSCVSVFFGQCRLHSDCITCGSRVRTIRRLRTSNSPGVAEGRACQGSTHSNTNTNNTNEQRPEGQRYRGQGVLEPNPSS